MRLEGSNKCSPPYHPNSNGEAEWFVHTFKNALYKGLRSGKSEENTVCDLLFEYGAVRHVATNETSAEMLMGNILQTTLDVLRTDGEQIPMSRHQRQVKSDCDKGKKDRLFKVGQEVFVRNYSNVVDRRLSGIIIKQCGANTYEVDIGLAQKKFYVDEMKNHVILWAEIDEPRRHEILKEGS